MHSRLPISVRKRFFQREIYTQQIPQNWVLIDQTELIEVRIVLEYKNYTNTPAVLEARLLEVGLGLWHMQK